MNIKQNENYQNFLIETKEILKDNNKLCKDVLWVGNTESSISWENFVKIANFEYDSRSNRIKIATDLLVVGGNWWLERHEGEGCEWWEYKELPKKPVKNKLIIKTVLNKNKFIIKTVLNKSTTYQDMLEKSNCDNN